MPVKYTVPIIAAQFTTRWSAPTKHATSVMDDATMAAPVPNGTPVATPAPADQKQNAAPAAPAAPATPADE